MKKILFIFLILMNLSHASAQNGRMVCNEESCSIEFSGATSGDGYPVVCPVGRSTVDMIRMAPRLETLAGKTIAVTGVSFMTEITHPEICSLIRKNYPDARILTIDEVGIGGVYPAPGITRKAKEEFQARLKELKVDAVICGNGGCGLCTPKDRGDIRDDVYFGTIEQINDYFKEMRWSDGLPVIPPTFDKVMEFMKYTDCRWDDTVAVLPIAHRNTTAWHVAVNGVMAGCRPEYMPILVALTKALGDSEFRRTLASTHAWIPYSWINGPVARQLGIDCGQGLINEDANMAIGRFMNLALMNLAGYYVKQDRMGTFGYPVSWCMVEDDAACLRVGWDPYHVRAGFGLNDNTITAASTLMWGNNMAPSTSDPVKLMELISWDIAERCQFALGSGQQYTYRTILMTEPVARLLAKEYRSPQVLEKKLVKTARRPVSERAFARYYANPGSTKDSGEHTLRHYTGYIKRSEEASMTPTPQWYDSPESELLTIPVMKYGMTAFIITGDSARNKVQTMPGGGYSTIKIELPKKWDELMEEAGYRPLKEFYLK